jgi:hypothetical protein
MRFCGTIWTKEIEPIPANESIPLGRFKPADYYYARNWYDCLFVWASLHKQGSYRRSKMGVRIVRYHFGRAMDLFDKRFEDMCKQNVVLRACTNKVY